MTPKTSPRSVPIEGLRRGMALLAVGQVDDENLEDAARALMERGEVLHHVGRAEVSEEDGTVTVSVRHDSREPIRYVGGLVAWVR